MTADGMDDCQGGICGTQHGIQFVLQKRRSGFSGQTEGDVQSPDRIAQHSCQARIRPDVLFDAWYVEGPGIAYVTRCYANGAHRDASEIKILEPGA